MQYGVWSTEYCRLRNPPPSLAVPSPPPPRPSADGGVSSGRAGLGFVRWLMTDGVAVIDGRDRWAVWSLRWAGLGMGIARFHGSFHADVIGLGCVLRWRTHRQTNPAPRPPAAVKLVRYTVYRKHIASGSELRLGRVRVRVFISRVSLSVWACKQDHGYSALWRFRVRVLMGLGCVVMFCAFCMFCVRKGKEWAYSR